jgi:DNA-directed RNA polymerase specialized sigma24 family protein
MNDDKQTLKLESTPLQKVLGFDVAEEIYDLLPLRAQIIIDCKIEGYTEQEIAEVLGVAQSTVSDTLKKARHTLVRSKLRLILESRQHYKESNPIVLGDNRP